VTLIQKFTLRLYSCVGLEVSEVKSNLYYTHQLGTVEFKKSNFNEKRKLFSTSEFMAPCIIIVGQNCIYLFIAL